MFFFAAAAGQGIRAVAPAFTVYLLKIVKVVHSFKLFRAQAVGTGANSYPRGNPRELPLKINACTNRSGNIINKDETQLIIFGSERKREGELGKPLHSAGSGLRDLATRVNNIVLYLKLSPGIALQVCLHTGTRCQNQKNI